MHRRSPAYDLSIPTSAANPRSPFGTNPPAPPLPKEIDGVPMQDVLNDPIILLQRVIERQRDADLAFEGTVINIATRSPISFLDEPNKPLGSNHDVEVPGGRGSIGNIPFLASNANASLLYATFWVEPLYRSQSGGVHATAVCTDDATRVSTAVGQRQVDYVRVAPCVGGDAEKELPELTSGAFTVVVRAANVSTKSTWVPGPPDPARACESLAWHACLAARPKANSRSNQRSRR